jgi:hypothetical protein
MYVRAPANPITVLFPTSVCIDSSVTLMDAAAGGTWSSSNTAVGSIGFAFTFPPGQAFTGVSAGTTTVSYTGVNACGAYTETAVVTVVDCTTGIRNVTTLTNGCNVYPNPATGAFNISANSDKYTRANCTVTNMLGETMKTMTINTNQVTSVDINFPTGVYFISITAGEEKYTTKMVIMQ